MRSSQQDRARAQSEARTGQTIDAGELLEEHDHDANPGPTSGAAPEAVGPGGELKLERRPEIGALERRVIFKDGFAAEAGCERRKRMSVRLSLDGSIR